MSKHQSLRVHTCRPCVKPLSSSHSLPIFLFHKDFATNNVHATNKCAGIISTLCYHRTHEILNIYGNCFLLFFIPSDITICTRNGDRSRDCRPRACNIPDRRWWSQADGRGRGDNQVLETVSGQAWGVCLWFRSRESLLPRHIGGIIDGYRGFGQRAGSIDRWTRRYCMEKTRIWTKSTTTSWSVLRHVFTDFGQIAQCIDRHPRKARIWRVWQGEWHLFFDVTKQRYSHDIEPWTSLPR